MEKEQPDSEFLPWPRNSAIRTDRLSDLIEKASSPFGFRSSPGETIQKVISMSYEWLDSLSGANSFLVADDTTKLLLTPYVDILRFLQNEGILNGASLRDRRFNDVPLALGLALYPSYPHGMTDGVELQKGFGHGYSQDIATVYSKAIGEFLERYFLTVYRKKNLTRASITHLHRAKAQFLNPAEMSGFSEEQKKHNSKLKWDDQTIFSWERLERLSSGNKVLAPAQLIYWNYKSDEPLLRELNTNGCGAYFTREGALLSALYEVIQRDAFLIHWLTTHSPPKIRPETVPFEPLQNLLRQTKRYGFKVHCLDTTLDTDVPSFAVVIEDLYKFAPLFSLGGGCHADPTKALWRAFEEALSVNYWIRNTDKVFSLPDTYTPFRDSSVGQMERLQLWANPAMEQHYRFLLAGPEMDFYRAGFHSSLSFASEKEELVYAVSRVESLGTGYEVYGYLARHPILKKLSYHAARAIVPALVPLYLNETQAPLGAARLKRFAEKFNGKDAPPLNPYPHPFP